MWSVSENVAKPEAMFALFASYGNSRKFLNLGFAILTVIRH